MIDFAKVDEYINKINMTIEKLEQALADLEKARADIEVTKGTTQKLVIASQIPPEEMEEMLSIYDTWEELIELGVEQGKGKLFVYNNKLYKFVKPHTPASHWIPGQGTESLYVDAVPTETPGGEEVVREIKENMLATEGFEPGEKGSWKGKIYKNILDKVNVWTPEGYPAGWELVE